MTSSAFSSSANWQQRQAIETTDGPLLIIAGPGSGKTFTLVERIVYLITTRNVAPESLLVVTFTEKAAQELVTRISSRLTELGIRFNLNEMYLGTIHSVCLRWLEEYREYTRLKRNFLMMDQFDQQFFLYRKLNEYMEIPGVGALVGETEGSRWTKSNALMRWVNLVSEEALDGEVLRTAEHEAVRVLGECHALYMKQLEEENALDFSTIQAEALRLLRGRPEVLAALQEKIRYMMVDEYQDTNSVQEKILFTLASGPRPNLCVVGDDDQGLYRFRGATIRNILEFRERFPEGACQQVSLTVNYRSHPEIIDYYNQWMDRESWVEGGTSFRYAKKIVPRDDHFPEMPTVVKACADTEEGWHAEVLAFLRALREEGMLTDWNQVAFLFKSVRNDRVVALAQFLEENGIAVYSPRSNQFFEREEVRLMIGALMAMFPQTPEARKWNADAHLEIWNYYDEQCLRPFMQAANRFENASLKKWVITKGLQHRVLTRNADYAFSGLFYQLLQFPLFSRYLDESLLTSGAHDKRPMRNLAIFSQLINKFEYLHHISVLTPDFLDKNLRDLFNQFFRFLKEGGIDEYEDSAEYAPSGCVSFFTIHQSKGLEFPVVVVGSLWDVPRKQYTALDEVLQTHYLSRPPFEPLESMKHFDFWRLYYTAFSRAQNLLALSYQVRTGAGRTPSKHFGGAHEEVPEWRTPALRLADLPLATVKDVKLKKEYSFTSHLLLYENCAEQYRFFQELEFTPIRTSPILFGVVVHQTIEDIHKAVLRGEERVLSEEQVGRWFDTNYAYLTKRERVYLAPRIRDIALENVLRYYRRQNGDWSKIREAEVDVSLVKEEYILSGTVDLIRGEGNTVELVDFKSERKPDLFEQRDRERIDRYRRQLEVYAHIVEERTGQPVSRTHLYFTNEDAGVPTISFDKDNRSIERTIATFDAVVGRIERKDFRIPERPAKLCLECDMRAYCDAKNWNFWRQG